VTDAADFDPNGRAILIRGIDTAQLSSSSADCNVSYDLRVRGFYRDHRSFEGRTLEDDGVLELLPGNAVIIQTEEEVLFPKWVFGQIVPKVSILQKGISNTPGKVDPGYSGRLLVTAFNHGKQTIELRRGQHFCSMFVSRIDGNNIIPYGKPSKQIGGVTHRHSWLRLRDRLEANIGMATTILIIVTAALIIVTALNTLMLLIQ
jgi:dCTP deaminase